MELIWKQKTKTTSKRTLTYTEKAVERCLIYASSSLFSSLCASQYPLLLRCAQSLRKSEKFNFTQLMMIHVGNIHAHNHKYSKSTVKLRTNTQRSSDGKSAHIMHKSHLLTDATGWMVGLEHDAPELRQNNNSAQFRTNRVRNGWYLRSSAPIFMLQKRFPNDKQKILTGWSNILPEEKKNYFDFINQKYLRMKFSFEKWMSFSELADVKQVNCVVQPNNQCYNGDI